MAKLSARGRTQLMRISRIVNRGDEIAHYRTEYAFMSDGALLSKTTYLKPDGAVHFADSWKIYSRHKLTPETIASARDRYRAKGWEVVVG